MPPKTMQDIELIETWARIMLLILIAAGGIGIVVHFIMTYKLTFGRNAEGKRMIVPALFIAMFAGLLPFMVLWYKKELLPALSSLPAPDFIAPQWRVITLLAGTVLNKVLVVVVCIVIGVLSYILIGLIILLVWKMITALKGGHA